MAKGRRRGELPPPLELACLKALWRLGEGTVREVWQALQPEQKLAYTTVLTVLDRLARKGAAERRLAGRCLIYAPAVSREVLRRAALRELLASYFDGSVEELLAFLRTQAAEGDGAQSPAPAGLDPVLL